VFPVSGSLLAAPPSLDRVPASPVPRCRRYYEGATTSRSRISRSLIGSLPGPTRSLLGFVLAAASAPGRSEAPPRARIIVQPAIPIAGALTRGREWDLSGSQAIHPVPLPRSRTPAGPTSPRQWRSRRCCPCSFESKGSSVTTISRLTAGLWHLLSTLHERCCHRPCKTRFRPAGWPLPGGRRTLWTAMKGFRVATSLPPFLGLS